MLLKHNQSSWNIFFAGSKTANDVGQLTGSVPSQLWCCLQSKLERLKVPKCYICLLVVGHKDGPPGLLCTKVSNRAIDEAENSPNANFANSYKRRKGFYQISPYHSLAEATEVKWQKVVLIQRLKFTSSSHLEGFGFGFFNSNKKFHTAFKQMQNF